DLAVENPKALQAGMVNLDAHVRILQTLGMTPVVAVNRFMADTDREVDAVVDHCKDLGVRAAAHTFHEDGGAGGEELARLVGDATKASTHAVRFAYKDDDAFEEKVAKVATSVYGAAAVKYDAAALEDLERLRAAGLDGLPVCIAKTQLSLSDDERALGAPTGWTLQVRGIRPSAGAGFLVVLLQGHDARILVDPDQRVRPRRRRRPAVGPLVLGRDHHPDRPRGAHDAPRGRPVQPGADDPRPPTSAAPATAGRGRGRGDRGPE